jgi:hypothetical protein
MDVAIQALPQQRVESYLLLECCGGHSQGRAGALHQGVVWRSGHSKYQRDAQHAFVADDPDLQSAPILECGWPPAK